MGTAARLHQANTLHITPCMGPAESILDLSRIESMERFVVCTWQAVLHDVLEVSSN